MLFIYSWDSTYSLLAWILPKGLIGAKTFQWKGFMTKVVWWTSVIFEKEEEELFSKFIFVIMICILVSWLMENNKPQYPRDSRKLGIKLVCFIFFKSWTNKFLCLSQDIKIDLEKNHMTTCITKLSGMYFPCSNFDFVKPDFVFLDPAWDVGEWLLL